MRLNRTKLIKAANESFAERGMATRIRYNSEWSEFQVKSIHGMYHADSLTDAIETAIQISGWRARVS